MPTPTRIPIRSARKTAASDATWYRRSNIVTLCLRASLAQGVQARQRPVQLGSSDAAEKWGVDGQLGARAVGCRFGEPQLDVDAGVDELPRDELGSLDVEE